MCVPEREPLTPGWPGCKQGWREQLPRAASEEVSNVIWRGWLGGNEKLSSPGPPKLRYPYQGDD